MNTNEYNKSLSARIRRRNAVTLKNTNTHKNTVDWVKTSPYGDYNEPYDNHKKDTNPYRTQLVNLARKMGVKHPGSKKMHTLKIYEIKPSRRLFQSNDLYRSALKRAIENK